VKAKEPTSQNDAPNGEGNTPTEAEVRAAVEKRQAMLAALHEAYVAQLDEEMGKLHNQFVAFIATARLPLPQVLLVLEILVAETIIQARARYLGEM